MWRRFLYAMAIAGGWGGCGTPTLILPPVSPTDDPVVYESPCTVTPNADGTTTLTCPDGTTATGSADAGEIAALEDAFWYCDYVATTRGVLATPMAACQFATDELKARKFGGSSRALAAWWQENKAAEHARLGQ